MANTVSNLAINFGVNTSELKTGLADVGNQLSGAGSKLGGFGAMLSPVGLAIGTVVAAGAALVASTAGIVSAVSNQMEALDGVAKAADRAGLSMETFQGFALAADLAGVSGDAFANSMSKLQRSLISARQGTGPAADAMRTLGLNVEEVSRMSSQDALLAIADAMQGISDPAQRTALAMDLFGKAGADLVPLLSGGSAAIREGTEAVEKYNLAISRQDAAKIEGANDAWTLFGKTVEGIWSQLAVAFAPAVEQVGESLAGLGGSLAGFFKESGPLISEFAVRFATMFTDIVDWLASVVKSSQEWADWLVESARAVGIIGPEVKKAKEPVVELTESWEDTTKQIDEAAKAAEKIAARGEALTKSLRLPDEIYADTITELKELAAAGAITQETFERGFRKAADDLNKAAERADQVFKPLNVGAATRNSAAGFAAVIDGQNAQKQLTSIVQKQLDEDRKHTQQNAEMLAAYKQATTVKVVSI